MNYTLSPTVAFLHVLATLAVTAGGLFGIIDFQPAAVALLGLIAIRAQ